MTRDYNGMLAYSTLLQKGMISQTQVAETQRVVTGNANELMIGDTTRQLTSPAQLQPDANRWTPTVSYAPGYRLSAPNEPAEPADYIPAATAAVAVSQAVVAPVASAKPQPAMPISANQIAAAPLSIAVPAAPAPPSSSSPVGAITLTNNRLTDRSMQSAAADNSSASRQLPAPSVEKIAVSPQPPVSTIDAPAPTSQDAPEPAASPGATATVSADPAAPAVPELTWEGRQGDTLRDVVTRWAAASNPSWHVDWATDLDYPIILDFTLRADNFLDAAARVFAPYRKAKRRFTLSQQAEQRVLIVEEE